LTLSHETELKAKVSRERERERERETRKEEINNFAAAFYLFRTNERRRRDGRE
jgi:hypothetical protein